MANITVLNGTMDQKEIDQYVNIILKDNPTRKLDNLELSIRRITGYLVGTMDRWNDAKTSEEHDRVKHSLSLD